ncbi:enolase-phosphatase E1-like [Camellia sinensis]|uniref:enolase-phosphatase E1-like n=1 Tax=Camellia sinensis TaxID=4442 RepID=UPI0010361E35|nr:enolase-phosphatase E1-like [Camellia sinensis]
MGRKKAVADDLLADIPNIITVQSSPSQSQPKPKLKRLKKVQPKATSRGQDEDFDGSGQGDEAEERAGAAEAIAKVHEAEKKEAEAKTAEAQVELIAVLAIKDAEIKAAHEKAYTEGATGVCEDYKKQVKQTCNKGFTLDWMATLKELAVSEDSPLKNASNLVLPFPPSLSQFEDEVESEDQVEAEKNEEATGAKSPTLNGQVLDLTQDEVQKTTSEAEVEAANKSIDDTLREIDVEVQVDKFAQLSAEANTTPTTEAGQTVENT